MIFSDFPLKQAFLEGTAQKLHSSDAKTTMQLIGESD